MFPSSHSLSQSSFSSSQSSSNLSFSDSENSENIKDKKNKATQGFRAIYQQDKETNTVSLTFTGRPRFCTQTNRILAKNFPKEFTSPSGKRLKNKKLNRNHLLSLDTLKQELKIKTKDSSPKKITKFIRDSFSSTTWHSKHLKKKMSSIVSKIHFQNPLSVSCIERAMEVIISNEFNNPENIYVGQAKENISLGSSIRPLRRALEKDYNSPKLSPATKFKMQKKLLNSSLDLPKQTSNSAKKKLRRRYSDAWSSTPEKYVPKGGIFSPG